MALAITKNIVDILFNYRTQTFNKYVKELKIIENNARNGIFLFEFFFYLNVRIVDGLVQLNQKNLRNKFGLITSPIQINQIKI